MARLTGLSPQQIQRIEAGDSWFSRDSMERICKALGCKPGELLDYEPDKLEVAN
jgi:putative transcriptional regulator